MIIFNDAPSDDLETYTRIAEYSEVAEELENEIINDENISEEQKRKILYPMLDEIKAVANTLMQNYIEHLKDRENLEKLYIIRENIMETIEKIDIFRNKIYELYK